MPELESSQEEADTRIILHSIHNVAQDDTECVTVVVHANDTDVIVLCTYYESNSSLADLKKLWVRTNYETYIPIHQMATSLGFSLCKALPFLHSLGGRDTTSYPYFVGKKAWVSKARDMDISAIEEFADVDNQYEKVLNLLTKPKSY